MATSAILNYLHPTARQLCQGLPQFPTSFCFCMDSKTANSQHFREDSKFKTKNPLTVFESLHKRFLFALGIWMVDSFWDLEAFLHARDHQKQDLCQGEGVGGGPVTQQGLQVETSGMDSASLIQSRLCAGFPSALG